MNKYLFALDPTTPPETLLILSQAEDRMQYRIARNPSTPYGIWIPRWGRVTP